MFLASLTFRNWVATLFFAFSFMSINHPPVLMLQIALLLLGTVFNVLMLWFRLPQMPAWAAWATLILMLFRWVFAAAIQPPLQLMQAVILVLLLGLIIKRNLKILVPKPVSNDHRQQITIVEQPGEERDTGGSANAYG